jgi:hypothetical protein
MPGSTKKQERSEGVPEGFDIGKPVVLEGDEPELRVLGWPSIF